MMNNLQKASKGIGIAWCGIIISILLAVVSMIMFSHTQSKYKEKTDSITQNMEKVGEEQNKKMNKLAEKSDGRNTMQLMNESRKLGEETVEKGKKAFEEGQKTYSEAQTQLEKDIKLLPIWTYAALLLALLSCVWGIFNLTKLRKNSELKWSALIWMCITFSLFAIGSIISLSSPIGFSYRFQFAQKFEDETTCWLTVAACALFVLGLIFWFIGSYKIKKVNPQFKRAYIGALLVMISFGLILVGLLLFMIRHIFLVLVPLVFLTGLIFIIYGWFTAGKLQSETTTERIPIAEKLKTLAKSKTVWIIAGAIAVIIIVMVCIRCFTKKEKSEWEMLLDDETLEQIDQIEKEERKEEPKEEIRHEMEYDEPAEVADEYPSSLTVGEYELSGTVAGKSIQMTLSLMNSYGNNYLDGFYSYGKASSDSFININGEWSSYHLELRESYDYKETGTWSLTYDRHGRFSGTMTNYKGNTYSASLKIERVY